MIPVTIVLYRYLMACKVDFSHRVGGKVLSRLLFRYTFILPLVLSISAIFFQDFLRDNLVCNGREEVLWYNLDNFFMKQEGGMLWYDFRKIMSNQKTKGTVLCCYISRTLSCLWLLSLATHISLWSPLATSRFTSSLSSITWIPHVKFITVIGYQK